MQNVFYIVSIIVVTKDAVFHAGSHMYVNKSDAHRAYVEAVRSYMIFIHGGSTTEHGFHSTIATESELDEVYQAVLVYTKMNNIPYALISEDDAYLFKNGVAPSIYDVDYSKLYPIAGRVSGKDSVVARTVSEALQEFSKKHGPLASVAKMSSNRLEGFDEKFFKKVLRN